MLAVRTFGGDPTPLGWGTTLAYAIAFISCVIVWARDRLGPTDDRAARRLWLGLGLLLLFLGLNKELDLQTDLVHWARDLSKELGLYQFKRRIGVAFFALTAIGIAIVLWLQRTNLRRFATKFPLAAAGVGVIGLYVAIRFAGIAHVEPESFASSHDAERFGFLELLGNTVVVLAAITAMRRD